MSEVQGFYVAVNFSTEEQDVIQQIALQLEHLHVARLRK